MPPCQKVKMIISEIPANALRSYFIVKNVYFYLVIYTFKWNQHRFKPVTGINEKDYIVMKRLLDMCDAFTILYKKPLESIFKKIPYLLDLQIAKFLSKIYDKFFVKNITWSKIIIFIVFCVKVGLHNFKIDSTFDHFFILIKDKIEPWIIQNSGWENLEKDFEIQETLEDICKLQEIDFENI